MDSKKKEMPVAKKAKMDNLQALRRLAMSMIKDHSGEEENKDGIMAPKKSIPEMEGGYDDAEMEMQEPEQSMLDESPEGDSDESEEESSEDDGHRPGEMRDNKSAASILEKMRKSAKKKKN